MAVRREAAVRNARGGARGAGQGLSRNVLSNAWKRASGVTHTRTAAKKPNGKEKCRTQRRICGKGKTCGECHALADFNNVLPDSFWVAIRSMSISSRSAASSERESDSCLEMRPEQMLFYTLTAPAQREDSENNEKDALVEGSYGNRKNAAGKEKSRTSYCWKCQHCGLLPRMALKV
jgi:hypothetical protein